LGNSKKTRDIEHLRHGPGRPFRVNGFLTGELSKQQHPDSRVATGSILPLHAAQIAGHIMNTLRKMMLQAGLAAMALGMAGAAQAAITYKFTATSAFDPNVYGSFELTTANFLTGVNAFAPASLTSCTVAFSPGSQDCGTQKFDTTFYGIAPFYETVAFGTADGSESYYYFKQGSFGTVGTHSSQIFGAAQFATLTVSDSMAGAVPEPATWAMMIAGFGLVGAGMRRRAAKVTYA
jgi:PEP-CTERM motif